MNLIRRVGRPVRHRLIEAGSYFHNITKPLPSNQIRLLIFGQGRTGSTLLESLICSTGYFHINGELLRTDKGGEVLYPIQYIHGLAKQKAPENFIFHTKIYQLTKNRKHPINPTEFLQTLTNNGWKFIYLRRRNKVKHVLSKIVADHRGHFHKLHDAVEQFHITATNLRRDKN